MHKRIAGGYLQTIWLCMACHLYGVMGHSGGLQRDGDSGAGKYLVKSVSGYRPK